MRIYIKIYPKIIQKFLYFHFFTFPYMTSSSKSISFLTISICVNYSARIVFGGQFCYICICSLRFVKFDNFLVFFHPFRKGGYMIILMTKLTVAAFECLKHWISYCVISSSIGISEGDFLCLTYNEICK